MEGVAETRLGRRRSRSLRVRTFDRLVGVPHLRVSAWGPGGLLGRRAHRQWVEGQLRADESTHEVGGTAGSCSHLGAGHGGNKLLPEFSAVDILVLPLS